jgi:chromosome segregation ATPase
LKTTLEECKAVRRVGFEIDRYYRKCRFGCLTVRATGIEFNQATLELEGVLKSVNDVLANTKAIELCMQAKIADGERKAADIVARAESEAQSILTSKRIELEQCETQLETTSNRLAQCRLELERNQTRLAEALIDVELVERKKLEVQQQMTRLIGDMHALACAMSAGAAHMQQSIGGTGRK